ncbi:MAG: AAA family ATPase [Clostridia bacterium]|nr:AAA family ATPase [Clostridia bacterium]
MLQWKSSPSRKPLVLKGARQVGKTTLVKEFGKISAPNP